jgi:hypothetical protein
VSQEVVHVLVNTVRRLTFPQLLDTEESKMWLSPESNLYQLHISNDQKDEKKRGGFKIASPAHLDSTLFMKNLPKGLHKSLYAKQVFYRAKPAFKSFPTSTMTYPIVRYLGPSAVAHVEMELKCILWAQALLQLSYDYINTFDNAHQ